LREKNYRCGYIDYASGCAVQQISDHIVFYYFPPLKLDPQRVYHSNQLGCWCKSVLIAIIGDRVININLIPPTRSSANRRSSCRPPRGSEAERASGPVGQRRPGHHVRSDSVSHQTHRQTDRCRPGAILLLRHSSVASLKRKYNINRVELTT
jgi:hypothetical protein